MPISASYVKTFDETMIDLDTKQKSARRFNSAIEGAKLKFANLSHTWNCHAEISKLEAFLYSTWKNIKLFTMSL